MLNVVYEVLIIIVLILIWYLRKNVEIRNIKYVINVDFML